jgi:hypothetical protein
MRRAWDQGRKTGRWDREVIPDEEEKRIQKSIDSTMRDVIRDRYNPTHALDGPMVNVTVVGAPVVKDLPSGPTVSEPWRPMHPTQDWLRLGSTVASANVESAEAALAKLEEEPGDG